MHWYSSPLQTRVGHPADPTHTYACFTQDGIANIVGISVGPATESLWASTFVADLIILCFAALQQLQYAWQSSGRYARRIDEIYVRRGGGALSLAWRLPTCETLMRVAGVSAPVQVRYPRFLKLVDALVALQQHVGVMLCYLVYVLMALLPPVSIRNLVTLGCFAVLFYIHMAAGIRGGSVGAWVPPALFR